MTFTQLSFSFAATQTDSLVNFAVSDESGQRGCFYPQPKFIPAVDYVTGFSGHCDLRNGFYDSFPGHLDAPPYVPFGGFDSMNFGPYTRAFAQVARG